MLYALLCQTSQLVTANTAGATNADITNGVLSLEVNCSLVMSSYSNGNIGSIIQSVVPTTSPGSNITIVPNPVIYLPVENKVINRIRMWVTDSRGNAINFNGEQVTYMLHLRKIA
jgi:hypothetical protein